MRRPLHILLLAGLLLVPGVARAQLDALIDVVVDAVEPTPVYDTGLREATENLASKIERLNRVLFGGAEETSAAYRYRTMYSELYDLTSTFSGFVDRSWANARRLESVYASLPGGDLADHARAVQATWAAYEGTVRSGSAVVARFKRLFSDPNVTNAEVRQAAREATEEINRLSAAEEARMDAEIRSTEIAEGLTECAGLITPALEDYVSEGRALYGTTISEGGSSTTAGTLGTAVIVILGLLCVVYAGFAGVHIMRGTQDAEAMFFKLLVLLVFSVVTILAIQHWI